MAKRYDWKRFWSPLDHPVRIAENGFLVDPESGFGRYENPKLIPTDALPDTGCLVLLGEAGIGKSTEISALNNRAGSGRRLLLQIDAADYSQEEGLRRDLFESDEVQKYKKEGFALAISLDSFDEALLEQPKIIGLLKRELPRLPRSRLTFRIACRTGAWPHSLTESLRDIFGADCVHVLELAPLRRSDVVIAVTAEGIDTATFIDNIERSGATPFAASPITLRFLTAHFRSESTLSASLRDIYETGLLRLCSPTNVRKDRSPNDYTPGQLLQVASRCAAMILLTGRSYVSTDQDAPGDGIADADLSGGHETHDGQNFQVTPNTIRRVLSETGLFNSRGSNRVGFAHRTYGEFLAARYLFQADLTDVQLRSLLFVAGEPVPQLIPQLREVAAWLASFDTSFFGLVIEHEPEVLLYSDVAGCKERERAQLVENLLNRVPYLAQEERWRLRGRLGRLRHETVAQQLGPRICGTAHSNDVRRLAIEIADEAGVIEVEDALVRVALDPADDYAVRATAATAIANLALPNACRTLKPLALGQAGSDPTDDLRGCGLAATWPGILSTDELLQALKPPTKSNYLGPYQYFLHAHDFSLEIDERDLPRALEWACALPAELDFSSIFARIPGRFATRALAHPDDSRIWSSLVDFVWHRLSGHADKIFEPEEESLFFDDKKDEDPFQSIATGHRRLIVRELVSRSLSMEELRWVLRTRHRFLRMCDVPWCLKEATEGDQAHSTKWAWLANAVNRAQGYKYLEHWLRYKQICPAVAEAMPWPDFVRLGSPEAELMKEVYTNAQNDRELEATGSCSATAQHTSCSPVPQREAALRKRDTATVDAQTSVNDGANVPVHRDALTTSRRQAIMAQVTNARYAVELSDIMRREDFPDEALTHDIMAYIQVGECSPEIVRVLLGWLIRHGVDNAVQWAESHLRFPNFTDHHWSRYAREAAICLFAFAGERGWAILSEVIRIERGFGKSVLSIVAYEYERQTFELATSLSDKSLGELLSWLLTTVPPSSDPDYDGPHFVGPFDSLRSWRDWILGHMVVRGTAGACDSLKMLCERFPKYSWLRDLYLRAHTARRRSSWMPPSPIEIRLLITERNARFVASSEQLLNVIVESLLRYEEELRGENATVRNLWDERLTGKLRPKDENHLSDNLAQHLRRDIGGRGVIINREVEIRRRQGEGAAQGENTDIYVGAAAVDSREGLHETVSAVIEVKGCWHRKVRNAMRNQLVDRYLYEKQCKHGLYVVGWFLCDNWDDADSRKSGTPWTTLQEARECLITQADAVNQDSQLDVRVKPIVLDLTIR